MTRLSELAIIAYGYAEQHYNDKDARFDVIVETMELSEVEEALGEAEAASERDAIAWAKAFARAQHEQELNQAWDGPESVRSSSRYDPAHDPAGPPEPSDEERRDYRDREPYIDSYTGYPHYTLLPEETARLERDYPDGPF